METFEVRTATYPHLAMKILSYGSTLKQKTSSSVYVVVMILIDV